jgi:hypothetical protein
VAPRMLCRLCLGSEGSEGAPTASDSGRYVNRRSGDPVYASYRHNRQLVTLMVSFLRDPPARR